MPTRIVTSTYRYKRPPKKRKPVLLEVPAIVTKRAASPQASAPKPAAPANDDRKPVIPSWFLRITCDRCAKRRVTLLIEAASEPPTSVAYSGRIR